MPTQNATPQKPARRRAGSKSASDGRASRQSATAGVVIRREHLAAIRLHNARLLSQTKRSATVRATRVARLVALGIGASDAEQFVHTKDHIGFLKRVRSLGYNPEPGSATGSDGKNKANGRTSRPCPMSCA